MGDRHVVLGKYFLNKHTSTIRLLPRFAGVLGLSGVKGAQVARQGCLSGPEQNPSRPTRLGLDLEHGVAAVVHVHSLLEVALRDFQRLGVHLRPSTGFRVPGRTPGLGVMA